jgi:hypothetical protein
MNTPTLPSPVFGQVLLLVAPDTMLESLFEMVARLALQGPLYVLDAGNSFQGYPLARALRRQGADIAAPLQQTLLARVFTCYQLAALLEESAFKPQPILLLDFLSTFYDQGVRLADRKRLLHGCLRQLQAISRRAPVVVWVRQRAAIPKEALGFLETVQRAAGQVWSPPRRPVLPVMQQASLF